MSSSDDAPPAEAAAPDPARPGTESKQGRREPRRPERPHARPHPQQPPQQQQRQHQQQQQQRPAWDRPAFFADAVAGGIHKEFLSTAQAFAREFGRALPIHLIRGFYGEILRIDMGGAEKEAQRILLLKPRLAWIASREAGAGMSAFRKALEGAIDKVLEAEGSDRQVRMDRLREGLEALLSYQAAHGRGRN